MAGLSDYLLDELGRFKTSNANMRPPGDIPAPRGANYMRGQHGAPGQNLTTITLPNGRNVTVNKAAAPAFQGFLTDLHNAGAPLHSIGSFNNRNIAGSSRKSQHAYGNAVDLNMSGRNQVSPEFRNWLQRHPKVVKDAQAKWNISHGADWKNPDMGHFEWLGGGAGKGGTVTAAAPTAGSVAARAITGPPPVAPGVAAINKAIAPQPGPGLPAFTGPPGAGNIGATSRDRIPVEAGGALPLSAGHAVVNSPDAVLDFAMGAKPGAPPPGWNAPPAPTPVSSSEPLRLTVNKVSPPLARPPAAPAASAPRAPQIAPASPAAQLSGRSKLAQDIMDSWLPHPNQGELTTFREPGTGNEIITGSIGGRDVYRNLGRTQGQPIQAPASLATAMQDAIPMPRPRPAEAGVPLPRPRPADAPIDPFISPRNTPGERSLDTLPVDLWRQRGQAPGMNTGTFPGPQAPLPGAPAGIAQAGITPAAPPPLPGAGFPGSPPASFPGPSQFPGARAMPSYGPSSIPSVSGPGISVAPPPAQAAPMSFLPPQLQWWQQPGAFGGGGFGGGGFSGFGGFGSGDFGGSGFAGLGGFGGM